MPSDTSPEFLVDDSPAARRTSAALALAAAAVLFGNCLITSPPAFSAQHQEDASLLKPIVTMLGLNGAFPTTRGIEIRNLISFLGAAVLALIAAFRLAATDRRPNLSFDDLLDFRRRAASPYFWWLLLLIASVLASVFSHAPDVYEGQVIIRFLHLAWWLPLAALLAPRHVGKLAGALVAALGIMAALGLWYYRQRQAPGAELIYPMGSPLLEGACLLPGVFIAIGLLVGGLFKATPSQPPVPPTEATNAPSAGGGPLPYGRGSFGRGSFGRWLCILGLFTVIVVALTALVLTRSRSAAVGVLAGGFTILCFLTVGAARRAALLAALIAALAGGVYMQHLRTHGGMGQQAHSIRVRLNYAWPYALTLFFNKPVLGQGDGAYALLAGRYARDDQIEDPNTIRFDEWSWFGRPDNEYLQMLSEIGLVGTIAFCVAIVLTIRRALRYCDRARGDPVERRRRWLVVGLAAALVAIAFEEGTSPALREPGLPPIFLAVWAMLWALVRTERAAAEPLPEERRVSRSFVRLSGVAAGIGAVILGYFAVQDWRAARASHEANMCIRSQKYAEAIPHADFAGEHLLDPLRKMFARLYGIEARTRQFDVLLAQSDRPLTPGDIAFARQTLSRLARIEAIAPRFLRAARLRADLWRGLAIVHSRANETNNELDALKQFALACLQHRADEPFNTANVQAVWNALYLVAAKWERLGGRPEDVQDVFALAQTRQRLDWLRCLLRAGEIAPPFHALFEDLKRQPDFDAAVQYLLNVGLAEAEVSPAQWQDRLAPETLRLAALSTALAGYSEDAGKLTEKAVGLYEKAGPRLFSAHAAALHEWVKYDFAADPTAHTDENLQRLARAHVILGGPPGVDQSLPGPLGETRLSILLAASREAEAERQADHLRRGDPSWSARSLAQVQLAVARAFANKAAELEQALTWAERAAVLDPESANAHGLRLQLALQKADDELAIGAARELLKCVPESDRAPVYAHLAALESHYSNSTIWPELHRDYPDFQPPAPATSQAAGGPTSAEAAPASTEPPNASPTSAPGG